MSRNTSRMGQELVLWDLAFCFVSSCLALMLGSNGSSNCPLVKTDTRPPPLPNPQTLCTVQFLTSHPRFFTRNPGHQEVREVLCAAKNLWPGQCGSMSHPASTVLDLALTVIQAQSHRRSAPRSQADLMPRHPLSLAMLDPNDLPRPWLCRKSMTNLRSHATLSWRHPL